MAKVRGRGSEGLEIKEGRYGRGVYAARAFAKGDAVESCPTLEAARRQVIGELGDYVFGSNESEDEVILPLGYGMLYNHSSDPNCEYVQDGPRVIAFVTLRDVEAGEELYIDYGEEWWEHAQPGARPMTDREARQELLDDLATAIDELAIALAVFGAAYELLDETAPPTAWRRAVSPVADRLRPREAPLRRLRRPLLAQAPHLQATERVLGSQGVRAFLERAVRSHRRGRQAFVELQSSMMPVEVGDRSCAPTSPRCVSSSRPTHGERPRASARTLRPLNQPAPATRRCRT